MAYDPIDKVAKYLTDKTQFIIYNRDKGLSYYEVATKEEKTIIELGDDQTIVYSLSPNRQYLVYNIADHIDDKIEESSIYLKDLVSNTNVKVVDIPKSSTFAGVMYWSKDSEHFYYTFRSSAKNLHFPDPETTSFYSYDLKTSSNKYFAKGNDFALVSPKNDGGESLFYNGHAQISGESADKKYLFVSVRGHGDPVLISLWRVNRSTEEKTVLFDIRKFDKNLWHYLLHQDYENNLFYISEGSNIFYGDSNKVYLVILNGLLIVTGKQNSFFFC